MTGARHGLFVALLALGAVAGVWAQDGPLGKEIESSSRQLHELRDEIKTIREELADLDDRRQDASASLQHLTREMGLVKELLAGLDQRELILAMQRDSLEVSLAAQRETYEMRRRTLATRLRALYMQGPQRDLELILTSESFSTLVARMKFTAMLARVDGTLVNQTRRQAQRIENEQRQLQAALAGIWEAREENQRERERLELLEAERRGLLREVTEEQDRIQRELARLQRQESQLTDLITQLETRRQEMTDPVVAVPGRGVPFADRRGDLPWPASGSVVREFGRNVHPRFGTVTMHNGVSIATVAGAPIYAVGPGSVEFADHLPGFGRCVILDHGSGYYTLYANLARIFVSRGSEVSGGQVLAELGDGGESGRPEFYFEIREGREPRDPRIWLRASH